MKIEEIHLGIKIFVPEFFSSNVYLVDNELLVDAGTRKFGKMLVEKFRELGIKPKILVLTHCHWDHIGGAKILQKEFGLKILLHEQDTKVIENAPEHTFAFVFNEDFDNFEISQKLKGGEKISTKNFCLEILHTPGHTQGSVCLYESKKNILISGDTFFGNAIGRTDLPGGDEKALQNSLKKLAKLEAKLLLPGHGRPKEGDIGKMVEKFITHT